MVTTLNISDPKTQQILRLAAQLAKGHSHPQIYPAHIALALLVGEDDALTESLLACVVKVAGGNMDTFRRGLRKALKSLPSTHVSPEHPSLTPGTMKVLREAQKRQKEKKHAEMTQEHLLVVLYDPSLASLVKKTGMTATSLKDALDHIQVHTHSEVKGVAEIEDVDNLKRFCIDFTAEAVKGRFDGVIGREDEIRRVIGILCRRTKNNAVLIGEPGVGKSAIVEGLALRIIKHDVPAALIGRLYSLNAGALIAGTSYRGQYEDRIKRLLDEVEKAAEAGASVTLFIDELHLLMDNSEASDMLKPALARGKFRCIGATTLAEYRKYIEKDAALARRFAQVIVNEPSVLETVAILRGIKEKYQTHHGIRILDDTVVQAATLAHRYLTSKRLPDSAIDLLDEACSNVRLSRETSPQNIDKLQRRKAELEIEAKAAESEEDVTRLAEIRRSVLNVDVELKPLKALHAAQKSRQDMIKSLKMKVTELEAAADEASWRGDDALASMFRRFALPDVRARLEKLEKQRGDEEPADIVTVESIAEVVAKWTGVPVSKLQGTEKELLLNMEKTLADSVVGQPEAVQAVANAIRLSRSGLGNAERPIASFLFAGPSGTGKTLMTKTLATVLFNSPDAMIRIDGSEYSEKHSVARLIGSPPGYIGHEAGGQLTEYIRRKPYAIVLIDEIEKAHLSLVQLFLQVLDDGRLTDGQGRVVNFKNTVIVITSNLGAKFLNNIGEGPIQVHTKTQVMGAIQEHFPPEFLNRIDETIIYRPLSKASIHNIVNLRLADVQKRLDDKKMRLVVSGDAKSYLAETGYSPAYGARPLNRVIQSTLLNLLSSMILSEQILPGEEVKVLFDRQSQHLEIVCNHPGTQVTTSPECQ